MSGNVCRLTRRGAVIAVVVFACLRTGVTPVRASVAAAESIWHPASIAWPPDLTTPSEIPTSDLVAAITADIDADGDLDIVATDQALNLLVWVNDGRGHLTRQRPRHSGGESTSPPGPAFEGRAASLALATFNDPPSARLGQRPDLDTGLTGVSRLPVAAPFAPLPAVPHRPSRAPPTATILT
jgi:hypothetical protein